MKAKFGSIVVDGRGKLGGHVYSKNRSGAYVRTKVTPVNPQTTSQLGARSRFTALSQGWRGLTQTVRDAWNSAVSDFQTTDIFGDLKNPTGFNLYQRLNNNLVNVGESILAIPPLPSAVQAVVLSAITVDAAGGTSTAIFAPAIDANTKIKVFATAPQSAGKSFVKSEYRQIDVLDNGDTSPADMLPAYIAKFGTGFVPGQKVFVKFIPVNINTGQTGTASQAYTFVV